MPRDGTATRERLLDSALDAVLAYGYAGTSIEQIIDGAGVTKGAFFHHFDSKAALARALVERFAEQDGAVLERAREVAEAAGDDPRAQVLTFVTHMENQFRQLTAPYPGCLFASYIGEAGLFDEETLEVARRALRRWRTELGELLRAAADAHPPVVDVDLDSLADQLTVVFEGAFILSKTYGRAEVTADQVGHYRRYLELLFPPSDNWRPVGSAP